MADKIELENYAQIADFDFSSFSLIHLVLKGNVFIRSRSLLNSSYSKLLHLFSLLSLNLLQRGLALISRGKCRSPLIKVTLRIELSVSNLRHAFTLN